METPHSSESIHHSDLPPDAVLASPAVPCKCSQEETALTSLVGALEPIPLFEGAKPWTGSVIPAGCDMLPAFLSDPNAPSIASQESLVSNLHM